MPSKIKRSQIQLTDLVSTTLATDASGNIIAGSAGGDMLKSENLSGLANNATARSNIGLGNVDNTSDANKPVSTATQTALNAKENTVTSGTVSQYYRGDKTFQTLDKTTVGLGNVDNTSDANKPVSTAQATAIGLKKTDSMATNKLLGRSTAGTGAIEEITLGTNLTLTAGVLDATGGGGGSPFATDIVVNSVTVGKGNNSLAANVVLGDYALSSATTGNLNTAVGSSALNGLTTGIKNVAVGNGALALVTNGNFNVAVGESANFLGNGSDNTAIGFESLKFNQANTNTAVGSAALKSNTTGIRNNAIGVSALTSNTTGSNNIANGVESLQLNTTGSSNNAMGYQSLQNNTTGDSNIAIGSYSLYQNTTGSNNVATGTLALGNGNGSDNTANGSNALVNASSNSNTAVGRLAGAAVSSGDSNTLIGKEADVSTGSISNSTAVGRGAIATASNQVVIGNGLVTQTTLRGAVTATSFNGVALTTAGGTTNFLRADGTYAAPAGGGGSTFWTVTPGTPARTSNTTFTVTDTANANRYDLLLQRGTQVKWLEATVEKRAMIVSATYATNTVTVTIVGDTMASIDASSLKYHNLPAKTIKFQYPLTTAVATDVCAPFQSDKAYRVYGAKVYLATAGVTGSSTYDINKGGTTMFTTKPTLATGVTASADFTANNGTSLASGDIVTIDIDAISTTAGVGLTVDLYLGESQLSQQA